MDESVIFVQELRHGDSDVYVFESDCTDQINSNTSRRILTRQCKNKNRIPIIDLSNDRDSVENLEIQTRTNVEDVKDNKISETSTTELKPNTKAQPECPVCLEPLINLQVKITGCFHVYCKNCLDVIISEPKPKCPKCRKLIIKKHIRPVFF